MTIATTVSMGGATPNVNYEIGQASTQTVSIGDRAVRNLANVAATGPISVSSLQNKGSPIPSGVVTFATNTISVYGWIDAGGWGALAATYPSGNTGGNIQALDVRGGTDLTFFSSGWYGHFLYGMVNTTGSAYTLTSAPLVLGSPNNWINNVAYVGNIFERGDTYVFSNLYNPGLFFVNILTITSTPRITKYLAAQGFNLQVSFVETGTSASTAYMTRSGSSTQKIGFISAISASTTPTISYFAAQGTDTYVSLARASSAIFAGGITALAHAWEPTGTTKSAAPATQVVGSGVCKVNTAGNVVFFTNNTSPFLHAWSFNGSTFGTKFANPPSLPTAGAYQIFVHPNDKAVCFVILGVLWIYAWDNTTGFGARFTNPPEINVGRTYAAFFNRSF